MPRYVGIRSTTIWVDDIHTRTLRVYSLHLPKSHQFDSTQPAYIYIYIAILPSHSISPTQTPLYGNPKVKLWLLVRHVLHHTLSSRNFTSFCSISIINALNRTAQNVSCIVFSSLNSFDLYVESLQIQGPAHDTVVYVLCPV